MSGAFGELAFPVIYDIFDRKCQTCHASSNSMIPKIPFDDSLAIFEFKDIIEEKIKSVEGTPPLAMQNRLSPLELTAVFTWLDGGSFSTALGDFSKFIQPIMETRCNSCHQENLSKNFPYINLADSAVLIQYRDSVEIFLTRNSGENEGNVHRDSLTPIETEAVLTWLGHFSEIEIEQTFRHTRISAPKIEVFPNPFSSVTGIRFWGLKDHPFRLTVFDLNGQVVRNLAAASGNSARIWNGRDLHGKPVASGTYIFRMRIEELTMVKRVALRRF